ncbi:MAG TPA: hypothetical protein VJU61_03195 [Polyangiaceae bacterium]|nr:hypothetical protein [Polyangiaceae bacterium]
MPAPSTPGWSVAALRLPKALDNDERGPALHAALRESSQQLWPGGTLLVPTGAWTTALASVLADAEREGVLVRGLELVERTLEREARGLSMVDAKSATERGSRVSRLLLLSADGTERFYRQVERLVGARGPRLLAIRLDAGSAEFAATVPGASGVVRALLLEHKDLVVRALLCLYPSASG